MRIAYIVTRADEYGGAQIHVRDLSKWMTDHGHDVHVIGGKRGIVSDAIESNGVTFHEAASLDRSIHPIKDLFGFFQIRKILRALKPDIISCHSSKAGILGRLAARSLGQKVIFTAHGWAFTDGISWKKRYLFQWLERFCGFFGDHVITVSRFDKVLALKHKIAPAKSISVIHNGMPYRTRQQTRETDNMIPQICMIARFSAQKDHTTLLNTLAMLRHKDWHLNLIGNGEDTVYRALAISLDIQDRVTFHGQRTDIPDYLETQDIYCLISHWEGFPRSILEAMRASLPVITTRTAGSPEAVRNFQSGYIVPERNPRALSRALALLIEDPLRRKTMGDVGRKQYERYFTFDLMAEKTLQIYKRLVG